MKNYFKQQLKRIKIRFRIIICLWLSCFVMFFCVQCFTRYWITVKKKKKKKKKKNLAYPVNSLVVFCHKK